MDPWSSQPKVVMYLNLQEGGAPVGSAFGCCYICRTSPTGTWVATGIDIYQEGQLVICLPCVKDFCHLIGFIDAEAVGALKENQKKMQKEMKVLQGDLQEAFSALGVIEKLKSNKKEPVAV